MEAYGALAKAYDTLMYDIDYDKWAAYIDRLIGRANASVYEAACGSGSISCRLEKKGHKVTAADISPAMLEKASEKARRLSCDITFICQDLKDISVGNSVDAVVCACDGPNYIDMSGIRLFADGAHKALKAGGALLFDISTRAKLKATDKQVYFDDGDDITCIWHNKYDNDRHISTVDIVLFLREGRRYNKYCETHALYAHDIIEVSESVRDAGFAQVDIFEFMSEKVCSPNTNRAQFVCRK
ncbi:MAG: class I SAM-dependent methyltransferase [Christensenellales bacterium]